MKSPELRFGAPVECEGATILPVVRQFLGRTETSVIGSVTPVGLFIVREPDVWFFALEEGCGPEDLAGIRPSRT